VARLLSAKNLEVGNKEGREREWGTQVEVEEKDKEEEEKKF
jgi:hypothetical protein